MIRERSEACRFAEDYKRTIATTCARAATAHAAHDGPRQRTKDSEATDAAATRARTTSGGKNSARGPRVIPVAHSDVGAGQAEIDEQRACAAFLSTRCHSWVQWWLGEECSVLYCSLFSAAVYLVIGSLARRIPKPRDGSVR